MADNPQESTFAERLAFACWLFYGLTGDAPSQTAMAEQVGRAQPSVREWFAREKPPADWEVHAPLAGYLGVSEAWLIRNAEGPPEPDLWKWWTGKRRATVHARPSNPSHANPLRDDAKTGKGRKSRGA